MADAGIGGYIGGHMGMRDEVFRRLYTSRSEHHHGDRLFCKRGISVAGAEGAASRNCVCDVDRLRHRGNNASGGSPVP